MIDPATLPSRISDILHCGARRAPDAPALAEGDRAWTYAELERETCRYAGLLRELGVRPGDRVMLVSENCMAQVALLFAIASLDAWGVNVNARLSEGELGAIRAHSTPRRILYTTAASPDALAHARRDGATVVGEVMAGPLDPATVPEPVRPDDAQVAALVYTTGTTGQPKGVMLTHANLLFVAATSSTLRGLQPSDHASGVLPISHVYGLASVMLGTLYAGACLHLAPRFSAEALLAQIRAGKLTIVQGVPAMYARLLALSRGEQITSRLRFCYAGGSPLDPALKREVEQVFGLPLHNGYGLTESGPTVSQTRLDAPRGDTSVGHPIPGVEVRIVGATGELWVRGPNVMAGYYRDPVQTGAALRPGGWLATGDLATQDEDGALFIAGRVKELIIRAGFNVYPLEVETALNSHPAVVQSAVVGRPVGGGEEEVVAFVEATGALAEAALQDWLRARLAPYKRPSRIVFMDALPAAPSGKILKSRLL
ncbi:class I adenylate-forming enzyme family protein [Massilia sp. BSC265]|uniref:class I adenylate-forming enzyme family protein n=1 Tax=Massilia sp. BSC265 TaxID=1549812 RepID=UPI0004E8BCA0|nr:AMP-binding protein [Massilia sp. BSC265]KFI08572.1 long-chain fatty acid--CoA ligase [Massilia sp. BSC265]